ncbi:MAG: hypothetical protein WAO02_18035 [Verrucomicrobiia bacterium]
MGLRIDMAQQPTAKPHSEGNVRNSWQGKSAINKFGVAKAALFYEVSNVSETRRIKTKRRQLRPSSIGRNIFGRDVLVQCEGYRGLAHQDGAGQWKSAFGNKTLPKFVIVIPVN